jgi:glycosyltransferase involved in cell wall biosynthesis
MYKYVFSNASIIHPSDLLLEKEIENLNLVNTKKYHVPNTCISFCDSSISSQKNINGIIRILFFSNLLPEKGLMVLLEAIKNVSIKFQNFELNIYGSYYRAKEVKRYKRFISENNLSDKVFIKGPCFNEEKERVFYESDIFVFPSFFSEECFPLVILEAMQAGLAIISTNIGAISELIEDGINGIIIDPNNISQLYEKIKLLVINKKLRKFIAGNARKNYIKYYSKKFFEDKMCHVFSKTLKN